MQIIRLHLICREWIIWCDLSRLITDCITVDLVLRVVNTSVCESLIYDPKVVASIANCYYISRIFSSSSMNMDSDICWCIMKHTHTLWTSYTNLIWCDNPRSNVQIFSFLQIRYSYSHVHRISYNVSNINISVFVFNLSLQSQNIRNPDWHDIREVNRSEHEMFILNYVRST